MLCNPDDTEWEVDFLRVETDVNASTTTFCYELKTLRRAPVCQASNKTSPNAISHFSFTIDECCPVDIFDVVLSVSYGGRTDDCTAGECGTVEVFVCFVCVCVCAFACVTDCSQKAVVQQTISKLTLKLATRKKCA